MAKHIDLALRINKNKPAIVEKLTAHLYIMAADSVEKMDFDEFAIRQYAQLDVSKLFLALMSQKPDIFKDYVNWQVTVFGRGKIHTEAIREHIHLLRNEIEQIVENESVKLLHDYIDYGLEALSEKIVQSESYIQGNGQIAENARTYLQLVLDKKSDDAIELAKQLVINKHMRLRELYTHIIIPVQQEIGRLWANGKITVADEHFATETTKSLIEQLRITTPLSKPRGQIAAVALGGEMHDIGIRIVSEFLRMEGYQVYFLGINTPVASLLGFIKRHPIDAIAVSITNSNFLWWAKKLVDSIKYEHKISTKILVGGYAFNETPDIWREIGADAYGRSAEDAVEVVNNLLTA